LTAQAIIACATARPADQLLADIARAAVFIQAATVLAVSIFTDLIAFALPVLKALDTSLAYKITVPVRTIRILSARRPADVADATHTRRAIAGCATLDAGPVVGQLRNANQAGRAILIFAATDLAYFADTNRTDWALSINCARLAEAAFIIQALLRSRTIRILFAFNCRANPLNTSFERRTLIVAGAIISALG